MWQQERTPDVVTELLSESTARAQRAETEAQRAEAEAQRADELVARIEEYERRFGRLE